VPRSQTYVECEDVAAGSEALAVTSTDLRARLIAGDDVPTWMMYPEDVAILRRAFPPRQQQGLTLFFTGLSGAGKSTVAKALFSAMQELGRPITLLDGDVVRLHLSKGLGFSKEDRDTNILRIGYVASLITKCQGIAICAPIAPYRETRRKVREMVEAFGGFVEVHVATPLAVCETRDPKGLYAKARAGKLTGMTGIDDPYEVPEHPEIFLDTATRSVAESVEIVLVWLRQQGFLPESDALLTR
jgi:sulfate adenylyltransferase